MTLSRVAAATLAGLILMAAPAAAEVCKDQSVSATSREYVSRSLGAFPGSWAAWRKEVKDRFGDGWQAWRRAQRRSVDCKQRAGRWTCTRTGIPCRPGGPVNVKLPVEKEYEPISRILRRGDSGEQVKTLQYLLEQAGLEIEADGVFGPVTERAVVAIQKKNRLRPDGVAGPKTIEILTGENGS